MIFGTTHTKHSNGFKRNKEGGVGRAKAFTSRRFLTLYDAARKEIQSVKAQQEKSFNPFQLNILQDIH